MKSLFIILFLVSSPTHAISKNVDAITVSGIGEVKIEPDVAIISFGVKTKAKTALEAQSENAKITNKVIKMLKADFKIRKNDLQTSSFNVSPNIQYLSHGKRKIDGYNVQNRFRLRYKKIKNIGKVLDKLTSSGVNDIGSINFNTDKHSEYEKIAIKLAMSNAKEKGLLLAKEADRKLGKVIRIIHGELPNHHPGPQMEMVRAKSMMADTPVATGQISITTRAMVTYQMQ
jgi:uncharacterized protein YggE